MKAFHILVLLGALPLMMGCGSTLAPSVVVNPIHQYKFSQDQEGLRIAVDPFFERDRLNASFDGDLLSYGILPVLIVIENHNPKAGYLLKRDLFSMTMQAGQPSDGEKGIDPKVSDKELEVDRRIVMAGFGATVVAPIIGVGAFVALIPLAIKETEVQKINENLRRKAFADRTLYFGESHFGFVYFPVTNREISRNVEALVIRAKELSSDKELSFVFQIKK